MKIYLTDQRPRLDKHLQHLKNRATMAYDKKVLREQISTVHLNTLETLEQINLEFLFDYEIFPGNIMTFLAQWQHENRQMSVGDTIVQQVYIPPFKYFSQKIVFGVRVTEVIDTVNRKGFSYETLNGHVEKGISTFTIEQVNDKLVFKVHTFSSPAHILTRLLGPIFSLPYQAYCTKRALENVRKQIERS